MWSIVLLYFSSILFVKSADIVKDKKEDGRLIPASQQKINEITNKIDKIANNLLVHSSSDNRSSLLTKLENKLLNASDHLSHSGKKHIKLIIEGIKFKVLNQTKNKQTVQEISRRAVNNNSNHLIEPPVIDGLSYKIESLIDKALEKVKTSKQKKKLLHSIKRKLLESFNKKQKQILSNSSIKYINESRRMSVHKYEHDAKNSVNRKSNIGNNGSQIKLYRNFSQNINISISANKHNSLTTPQGCYKIHKRICDDIKKLNSLKCREELGYITLDKLCDGVSHCLSRSDENHCDSQVIDKVHFAEQIMADMDKHTCFQLDIGKSVLSKQTQILRDVLEMRLNNYKKLNSTFHKKIIGGKRIFNPQVNGKQELNQIAIVISSLALALDGTLCVNKFEFDTRRNIDIFEIDLDKEFKESVSSPKTCKCEEEFCYNCTYHCQRLCRQKHSLANWNCDSINGTSTVSLNVLCDGKLDCFDESDEKGCITGSGYGKFEAREIYSNILKMLKLKASKEQQSTYKNLLYLSSLVTKLQNLTMKAVPKLEPIKTLRDKCYSMLRKVYFEMITQSYIDRDSGETYLFLLTINQNLGTALKRSHTGNNKMFDSTCLCNKGTCSKSMCSKVCARACAVEPKLTKYYCKGNSNKSVSVGKICDGIQDCENGYDEINCKKDEICRRHHLILLRHNLQNIGSHYKGTALGELLYSWKIKVLSTLKVVESQGRPTPKVLKKVIQDLLKDLVITFGYVKSYRRRNTNYALGKFLDISQIVLEAIKSCNK